MEANRNKTLDSSVIFYQPGQLDHSLDGIETDFH